MLDKKNLFAALATWLIMFAMLAGFLVLFLLIPALTRDLESTYTEFQGDSLIIQLQLSAITIAFEVALLSVTILLRKVISDRLLSQSALTWVNLLAISAFVSASLMALLLLWLTNQAAAPPAIALALLGGSGFSIVVGFITLSLKRVLTSATEDQNELAGVI